MQTDFEVILLPNFAQFSFKKQDYCFLPGKK